MNGLSAYIEQATGGERTLSVYSAETDPLALRSHFEPRNVTVEARSGELPGGLCVLHDGERVLAASPLDDVVRAVGFDRARRSNRISSTNSLPCASTSRRPRSSPTTNGG